MLSKKEKRKLEISIQAYEMLLDTGVDNFSVNNLLENITMSKGNFYHYFKNKDELFCEALKVAYGNISNKIKVVKEIETFEDKLLEIFAIYLSTHKDTLAYLSLVNQMYYMFSNKKNIYLYTYMQETYHYMFSSLEYIMKEEIANNKLNPDVLHMVKPLVATADGMLTHHFMLEDYNFHDELKNYLSFISKQYSLN
ncbi:TetR/AcrR family transcriptional regulator [Poseidonibacter lekithochrous]|uniref:TetR/AcrR family transcriptional regulator n=1 Tax=Poseidonibacter lekithochrous TaxID=1904463 RepID=UPI0008FC762E|nr:TetR/AcrR family transcriptional regulator [Poseidonibacter lekithochrous]QKJ22495.1 transcriptional regulator, TetR/AcrR family [Poseidonibacter lekithochrous]